MLGLAVVATVLEAASESRVSEPTIVPLLFTPDPEEPDSEDLVPEARP